ncbi:hypothetical protein GCM10011380_05860 [Sphingomonas metalli]|uniref:Glycosyltransferase 2-like domain-containing protein n=1 Tax=Sphingomonas metalli TaxID=1779358 RepID=A0A916SUX2_9SPHN|nr:glycosyltransferase family A protein [Sphingomonas metalli]GGB19125.1 hypothetical protein GCM10011380_05860 [Sphingomonas metalli]
MYLDLDRNAADASRSRLAAHGAGEWTVIVPFFNERACIAATIASLSAQTVQPLLLLVDNGSTDGGAAVARAACERLGVAYRVLTERAPGKIAALAAGLAEVRTPYVATCDADTLYPRHYLAAAQRVLEQPGCAIAGAYYVAPDALDTERLARARTVRAAARLLPRQSHTGGAGQAFRTAALRAAGGFDARRWSLVLEDHEIVHRVLAFGTMRYAADLWCSPSPRERDRDSIRWTLVERLLYSAAAPWAGDWFFYRFLAPRLRRRKLVSSSIRERCFQPAEGPILATPHPVF